MCFIWSVIVVVSTLHTPDMWRGRSISEHISGQQVFGMCFLLLCNLLFTLDTSSTCWFFLAQVLDPLQPLEWLELRACMIEFFWERNGHRVVNVLPLNNSSKSSSKRAPMLSSISILFWSFYCPGDRWCADGIDDLLRIRASELGIHYSEIPSIIRNRF